MRQKRKLEKLRAALDEALVKLDDARDWEEHQLYQEVVSNLEKGIEELEAELATPLPSCVPYETPVPVAPPPPAQDGGFFGTAQLLDVLARQQPMDDDRGASAYPWSPTMLNLLQVPPLPLGSMAIPLPMTVPMPLDGPPLPPH
eukprot:TRINITY_DN27568_c0_g1_i1.p2 TRINITY_DN27568_c0_g1~~TRINITY_DN27568_c0_g1_i1.p2  ORF type:complete len:144 (+),score=59.07 TRINITY_DN27568_c0_g1_i1:79-510(+)